MNFNANNGAGIYNIWSNYYFLNKNCFLNCSCINWGLSIYLSLNLNDNLNISELNIFHCYYKDSNSRSLMVIINGFQEINYLNISKNKVATYDIMLFSSSKY